MFNGQNERDAVPVYFQQEVDRLRDEIAALRTLLEEAYRAMREPTGEWHDIMCNTVLPKIRGALDATRCPNCDSLGEKNEPRT